jgi:hypothetical protein
VFVLVNAVVPLVRDEFYPFTSAALFSEAPRVVCRYLVRLPDGRPVSPALVGLGRFYWGLRGFTDAHPEPHPGGVRLPSTLDRAGVVASESDIRAAVESFLAQRPALTFLDVTQEVIGAGVDGRLAIVSTRTWRIHRHRGDSPSRPPGS